MGRLSLVLADGDTEYLSKLERYLIVNYPQRFEIISFASREKLAAWLNSTEKADILLVNNEMLKDGPITANGARPVVLAGDGEAAAPAGCDIVQKYQHADRLVADILRFYSAGEFRDCSAPGQHRTRIVCVCSPSGGTGKSSIAAGCSILCENRGNRAFYLDLEAVPSTEVFFHSDSGQSFSNVIFHLKGRNGNLGLRLEGASSMDFRTGVHFFRPPENLLERNELTAGDVSLLLDTFRKSSAYDTVFIDMDGGFDPVNTAVMSKSDVILLVLNPGQASSARYRKFIDGIEHIKVHCKGSFGKIITVLNRSAEGKKDPADISIPDDCGTAVLIGECTDPASDGFSSVLTENTNFLSGVSRILECLPAGGAVPAAGNGGGGIAC